MGKRKLYVCRCCGRKSTDARKILSCEARHLNLSLCHYKYYLSLLREEQMAYQYHKHINSAKSYRAHKYARNAVLRFQKNHNINL